MSVEAVQDAATSGLEGLVVARTELSDVDGARGKLVIRGYDVEQIAGHATFEEVAFLLWHGELPGPDELADFRRRLAAYRELPQEAQRAVELAADRLAPMDALRFAVASLDADDADPADESRAANLERAARLLEHLPAEELVSVDVSPPEPAEEALIASGKGVARP